MISAVVTGGSLAAEDLLPDLVVALACYCVGDSSALHEWYEPLVDEQGLSSITIYLNDHKLNIEGRNYSGLVNMPHIAVRYKGEWIGDRTVEEKYKFVYEDLVEGVQRHSTSHTNIFS